MRVLGRILQVIGWLWFAAGILGPVFGLDRISFFPGLILIFFSRVIRAQSARTESREPQTEPEDTEPAPRPLNTERHHPAAPSPSPQFDTAAPQPTREHVDEPLPPTGPRDDLLERIVAAGREITEDTTDEPVDTGQSIGPDPDIRAGKPMTSEEMIARAHRRWDSKRR